VTPADHESIDELLAGYALGSLSGADAAAVDRLLSEHVPGCARCRETLDAFTGVAADLGLDAPPIEPPETLLPKLRHELESPAVPRRRPVTAAAAVAASVVAVVGLAGLAIQGARMNDQRTRTDTMAQALDMLSRPGSTLVPVGPAQEITAPGVDTIYLFGHDIPPPPTGSVYRVWLVAGGAPTYWGEFVPDAGQVILEIHIRAGAFDDLWVTVDPEGSAPTAPSLDDVLWEAS
jgi:anti-sigma-K factor RskA